MDQRLQRHRRLARRRQKFGLPMRLLELKSFVSNHLEGVLVPLVGLLMETARVIVRCAKRDRREFQYFLLTIMLGFLIIGFLINIIKLLHIPGINIVMG